MIREIAEQIRYINMTEVQDEDGNVTPTIIYALIEAIETIARALSPEQDTR